MRPKIISQNIVAHVMKPFDRIIIMATYDKEGYLTLDTVMNTYFG
jgi:PIN domain nuclease of toxin-antitoxin system